MSREAPHTPYPAKRYGELKELVLGVVRRESVDIDVWRFWSKEAGLRSCGTDRADAILRWQGRRWEFPGDTVIVRFLKRLVLDVGIGGGVGF